MTSLDICHGNAVQRRLSPRCNRNVVIVDALRSVIIRKESTESRMWGLACPHRSKVTDLRNRWYFAHARWLEVSRTIVSTVQLEINAQSIVRWDGDAA